jgi:hypothetical protein
MVSGLSKVRLGDRGERAVLARGPSYQGQSRPRRHWRIAHSTCQSMGVGDGGVGRGLRRGGQSRTYIFARPLFAAKLHRVSPLTC